MTCALLFILNWIPGLSLRASPAEEEVGLDDSMLGEFAYDYVEITRAIDPEIGASNGTSNGVEKA